MLLHHSALGKAVCLLLIFCITKGKAQIVVTSSIVPTTYGQATGSITLTGQPGYTYSWSNSATTNQITQLATGEYTVTVTNSSETITNSYSVGHHVSWYEFSNVTESATHELIS